MRYNYIRGGLKTMSMSVFKHLSRELKSFCSNGFGDIKRSRFTAYNSLKKKTAFTLAEVLITLGIIGVVAAMTLPTLINNYQKKETISKLKKVYAILGNTTSMAMAEYGDTVTWELPNNLSWASSKAFAEKYMIPYLKVARTCENNNEAGCSYPIKRLNGQSFNNYNEYTKSYRFYLADGTFICIAANNVSSYHDKLVQIIFDINGQKNPNKVGKDVFFLEYFIKPAASNLPAHEYTGRILPANLDYKSRSTILGSGHTDFCHKNRDGKGCLAVIFIDGWEIKNDYPW